MAYVQFLALVLCSFFIQDVLSATTPQVRGSQKTAAVADVNARPARPMKRSATIPAAATTEPAVPIKLAGAGAMIAGKKAGSKRAGEGAGFGAGVGVGNKAGPVVVPSKPLVTKTVRRTTSRKAAAPPPPPKYPNLAKVEEMVWEMVEDMNRTSESGKLTVRSVRNAIEDLLKSRVFWFTLVAGIRRRAKLTNNRERADKMIDASNALTSVLTGPMAARGLEKLADDVYDAAVMAKSDSCVDALSLTTDMVNGGQVTDGLKAANNIINSVEINPDMVTKVFSKIIKFLNSSGAMVMSQGMANGLLTVSSGLNRQRSRKA